MSRAWLWLHHITRQPKTNPRRCQLVKSEYCTSGSIIVVVVMALLSVVFVCHLLLSVVGLVRE
jgi:hypothetical protein